MTAIASPNAGGRPKFGIIVGYPVRQRKYDEGHDKSAQMMENLSHFDTIWLREYGLAAIPQAQ